MAMLLTQARLFDLLAFCRSLSARWEVYVENTELARKSSSMRHPLYIPLHVWYMHGTINKDMEKDILQEANFWRQVLDHLINVTLTLAMNNLPFRGHWAILGQMKSGNFLSITELMVKYDPFLNDLISCPARSLKYLSPSVKN